MNNTEITFIVEEDDTGSYVAYASHNSIVTQAETFEELKANVKEAVECYFDPGKKPQFIHLHFVKDEVFAL
jgi:predicted RNase H-like HicB family nuclease